MPIQVTPTNPDGTSGNLDTITLLASQSWGIGSHSSTIQSNPSARGVIIYLDITVIGTGTVLLHIQAVDPVTTVTPDLFAAASAAATNGVFTYVLYPGVTGGAITGSAGQPLPRSWQVTAVVATGAVTFSVTASLIV